MYLFRLQSHLFPQITHGKNIEFHIPNINIIEVGLATISTANIGIGITVTYCGDLQSPWILMVLLILTTTLWTGCYCPHFKDKVGTQNPAMVLAFFPVPSTANRGSFSWYENVVKPTSGRNWCGDMYHSWDCSLWETFPLRKHTSLSLSNLVLHWCFQSWRRTPLPVMQAKDLGGSHSGLSLFLTSPARS